MKKKVSIIIPSYNEAKYLPKLLKKIKSFDKHIKLHKIINSKNFGIAYYYAN